MSKGCVNVKIEFKEKYPEKESTLSNYRPLPCLSIVCNKITAQMKEEYVTDLKIVGH